MKTVLIVDDEAIAIQAIRKCVDWNGLGVTRILDASNGQAAQEILEKESVQVVVCDIEMPRMSGIELLNWMKETHSDSEMVILTCHESFSLAQKAMGLGCVEYVLKPIAPNELTASIHHALQLWDERKRIRDASTAYEKSTQLRRDQYIQDILEKNVISTAASLQNYARKFDLNTDCEEIVWAVRVSFRLSAQLTQKEREAFAYGVCNIAEESWSRGCDGWYSLYRSGRENCLLVGTHMKPEFVEHYVEELRTTCRTALKQEVGIFTTAPCSIIGLCAAAEELEQMELRAASEDAEGKNNPAILVWKNQMLVGDAEKVRQDIAHRIENLNGSAQEKRNQQTLRKLADALHSALDAALEETNAERPTADEPEEFESVTQFLSWVQWATGRAEQLLRHTPGEDQVIQTIKDYIELNIHQDLTRESIATAVFLNPDYTARLFKKKTGQSLNDYILEKRLALARQLLAGTDIPVGDLSITLGYASFSHFTKLFKAAEGMTPSEYRKQHNRNA